MSTTRNSKKLISFKWYQSLQVKIAAIFVVLFLLISCTIFMILKSFGDRIIAEQAYLRLSQANNMIVSELNRHTELSATLAQTMADVAKKLPYDEQLLRKLVPQLFMQQGAESYISGASIWPVSDMSNKQFYWIRDESGEMVFNTRRKPYDHAKHPSWYQTVSHLTAGQLHWSTSYIDNDSLEPMVSVSAPLVSGDKTIGIATIDLRLVGLQHFLKRSTMPFSGYAFVVDEQGNFLSYPERESIINDTDKPGEKAFINYQTLANSEAKFAYLSALLPSDTASQQREQEKTTNSMAALLFPVEPSSNNNGHNQFIPFDGRIQQAAFANNTRMPITQWQVITIMPYAQGAAQIAATSKHLMLSTLLALLLTIIIIWLFVRYFISNPIGDLAKQLEAQIEGSSSHMSLFSTRSKGELNALVEIFNLRTRKLLSMQNKMEQLANFDPLTGLPNRRMLNTRLNSIASDKNVLCGALLFIDLDDFKRINDTLGHNVGDELLRLLARRFSHCLGRKGSVARLGGDEFVVLLTDNRRHNETISEQATHTAQRLVDAMQSPLTLNGRPYHMTISIGIAPFSSKHCDADELLRKADTAMYQAKAQGKNCYCLFSTEMQVNAYHRAEIEDSMRSALQQKLLFLEYQPQVDQLGNCVGVEALVRWQHEQKGLLSPAEFIEIAEQCGMILELGAWILKEACQQLKDWQDEGLQLAKMAVNVSPKQFRDNGFVETVRRVLQQTQISPQQLTLEITEGLLIDDVQGTINKMNVLTGLGVQISIDDFGTGYSSLRYLKELPLQQLKIDQSFVRDINNQPKDALLVTTILAIASGLSLNVVAEGVENKQQFAALLVKGCKVFQGYYFSKPLTASQLGDYLRPQQACPRN